MTTPEGQRRRYLSICIRFLSTMTAVTFVLLACDSGSHQADNKSFAAKPNQTNGFSLSANIGPIAEADWQLNYAMPEIVGAGVALFDHDNDQDLDIFLVNEGSITPGYHRLFTQGPDGQFKETTTSAKNFPATGYGMGVALGDIDNDGDLDIFVSSHGPDSLYRNDGQGHFVDISTKLGLQTNSWTTSAVFVDVDLDGYLDLFIVTYVDDNSTRTCKDSAGAREYCGPLSYLGQPDRLLHNNGDGSFTDISALARIGNVNTRGLGVFSADFNADGLPDIYTANDGEKNSLWINTGNNQFEDQGLIWGMAYNAFGKPEASMGIAAGDINNDQQLDIYLTHLVKETNTLYTSIDNTGMQDSTSLSGTGYPSMAYTGWGVAFLDMDQDGDLDLAIANGRINHAPHISTTKGVETKALILASYGETNLIFRNQGTGKFTNACVDMQDFCNPSFISRALVTGDTDNDGDLDILIGNNHGPLQLFRNDLNDKGNWIKIRALDPELNRDAIGAMVQINYGGQSQIRSVTHVHSYLSAGEASTHFGTGTTSHIDEIIVTWPGGKHERFAGTAVNQAIIVVRGQGKSLEE